MHARPPDTPAPSAGAAAEVRQLGDPVASFEPARGRLVGRIVAGAATAAVGVALLALVARPAWSDWADLPWDGGPGWNRSGVLGLGAAGLVGVAAGAGVIAWARRDLASRVHVCPGGCYRVRPGTWRVCPWDRVEGLQVVYPWPPRKDMPDSAAPPGAPGCTVTRLEVRLRGGREVAFTDATVRDLTGLAILLQEECDRRGIPWAVYRP